VFSNPVKILQWILPSNTELKEFSSLLCLSAHFSMPSWQSIFSTEHSTVLSVFSVHPMHSAQCPPGRALTESSVILSSSSNSQQSSSSSTSCLRSMPTWQSSTELTTKFCLQLCFSYTALPPEVFNNLKVFFLS
jgi:hypothetical protein